MTSIKMHLFQVRFFPTLWARVTAGAVERRVSLSQWIRSACVRQLHGEGRVTSAEASTLMAEEDANAPLYSSVARPLVTPTDGEPTPEAAVPASP